MIIQWTYGESIWNHIYYIIKEDDDDDDDDIAEDLGYTNTKYTWFNIL